MDRAALVVSIFLLGALSSPGQGPISAIRDSSASINAPVMIAPAVSIYRASKCEEIDGIVKLNAVVDQSGSPHDVAVTSSDSLALNDFAARWIGEQRFEPGTVDGVPATIAIALTVGLHTCIARGRPASGISGPELEFTAHPFVVIAPSAAPAATDEVAAPAVANVEPLVIGGRVSAPMPTLVKDPAYPDAMKSKKEHGRCVLSVLVDATGFPREVRVVKQLTPAMDQSAVAAVRSWRFRPALEDGNKPVPVLITVSVAYLYHEKQYFSIAEYLPVAPDVILQLKRSELARVFSPPVLLNGDEARSEYMPRSRVPGDCLIAAVIGTNGIPIDVRAANNLDSSLGVGLVDVVQHMRFKPAMKDAMPVPLGLVIAFRYSQRDMLRTDSDHLPWWMDTVIDSAILAWIL